MAGLVFWRGSYLGLVLPIQIRRRSPEGIGKDWVLSSRHQNTYNICHI